MISISRIRISQNFLLMTNEVANWITVIGTLLSLVGVGIAIWQIQKTRRVAQAAKDASDQTQKIISRNLLIYDVKTCLKNLDEIQSFVRIEKFESARLRTSDLIGYLYQIEQRLEGTNQEVPFEFEEMFSQLSIIREKFEKKVIRTSARINGIQINNQLSKVSDDLNKLIGGTIIAIEVGEENG